MKLGLLTAAFPDLTLDEVAEWAAANGFETLEIACWPAAGGERRRYAGVTHIDVDALDAGRGARDARPSRPRDLRRSPTTRTTSTPTTRAREAGQRRTCAR